MDKKIQLKVVNITHSQDRTPAYAMLLQEIDGNRQFPVIIGPAEAQAITFQLNSIRPMRPPTHDLFASTLHLFGIEIIQILIYKAVDGVFYAHIYYKREEETVRIDSRTSDAIALALRTNAPIYVVEKILDKECIPPEASLEKKDTETDSADLGQKDIQALRRELNRAVKDENYELASVLRDEIARRQ